MSLKLASSLSPPSIVKKVRTGSKNSQGQKSRELTTPPEPPNSGPCEALSVHLESRLAGTGAVAVVAAQADAGVTVPATVAALESGVCT